MNREEILGAEEVQQSRLVRIHTSALRVRCFFFSSRRRHTRFDCDWSSDVCSSDLERREFDVRQLKASLQGRDSRRGAKSLSKGLIREQLAERSLHCLLAHLASPTEIGRASCRERV